MRFINGLQLLRNIILCELKNGNVGNVFKSINSYPVNDLCTFLEENTL